MARITLAEIDNSVQLRLRNIVNSPLSQSTRVEAYNRVIDFLQSKAHWNCTRKRYPLEYLSGETEYSLSGLTDFKAYEDLRFVNDSQTRQYQEFEEIDGQEFALLEGRNVLNNNLNFEERDGETVMRILSQINTGKTTVDAMTDLSTGRTWASNTSGSDATTLAVDTSRAKDGDCLKFNIDVSQSVNNYAEIYTSTVFSTVIDASDLENLGHFRFWLGLHSVSEANLALISSVTFVWGSDSSATPSTKANYWSLSTTTPADGGDFRATWNRMDFDWASATQTGSPSASSLRYFEIRVTYAAGMTDTNNIRVDSLDMYDPTEMELVYFSKSFVNNDGTWQEHFSTDTIDTTEELLLPTRHSGLFINLALKELYPQKEKSNNDYIRVANEINVQLPLAIQQDGNPITRAKNEFAVQGTSNGRDDNYTQW